MTYEGGNATLKLHFRLFHRTILFDLLSRNLASALKRRNSGNFAFFVFGEFKSGSNLPFNEFGFGFGKNLKFRLIRRLNKHVFALASNR